MTRRFLPALALLGLLLSCPGRASAQTLYVANGGNNTIERFTAAGTAAVFANSGLNFPNGLAFDAAGNLYVASDGSSNLFIVRITPGGVGTLFASTGLNQPVGLACDPAGNLYATNTGNNTIEKFTPLGVGTVFASTGLSAPQYLAFQVPEPSVWALLGVGAAGLALTLRRRRRRPARA